MKKWMKHILSITPLALALLYTSYFRITKNFYAVDPGKLYRSAQLTRDELKDAIHEYGIKTVISLRGDPPSLFGQENEETTLVKEKVEFHSFPLKMDYYPNKKHLNEIIELLHSAPKPILIHCRSGADRTGMISAIYAIEEMHQSKDEALGQLAFKYWHLRGTHKAMLDFVKVYQGREWARNSYDPCNYPNYKEHISDCGQSIPKQ